MNFASWAFLALFLPVVILGFLALRGADAPRRRQAWLIGASLVFYAVSGVANLAVLAASIAVNYIAGRTLVAGLSDKSARKAVQWLAVAFNVGLLVLFKVLALDERRHDGFLATEDILIPLALSFVTFQQIGFVVACYRRKVESLTPFNYLFFVAFFPQLVMGPILQWQHIEKQLSRRALARTSSVNLSVGFSIFLFGLAKKVLLADPLAEPVGAVYAAAAGGMELTTPEAWFAITAFQLQLFLDFSAYADMAIGLARMVNINLPINFDQPLHAVDRFDLWRRWHITFVMFMRNNVFMPLVRHARLPTWGALTITGILSGLWHGLGWTFIVWGLLQTALLLGLHWRSQRRRRTEPLGPLRLPLAIALTFTITSLMGALFRAPSMDVALTVYAGLLPVNGFDPSAPFAPFLLWADFGRFFAAAVAVWLLPDAIRLFARYWTAIDPRPEPAPVRPALPIRFALTPAWAAAMAALLIAILIYLGDTRRFIYVQF